MSIPRKHTTWGKVHYQGEIYGVLQGFHLNRVIFQAYEHYCKDRDCIRSSAPWSVMNVQWSIENEKLYLTNIGKTTGLLTTLFGSERILADWVGNMSLLVKRRKVCRSYESRSTYIYEMETIQLTFDQGRIIGEQNKSEFYSDRELKNYLHILPAYATLRVDSDDLLGYLDNTIRQPPEDQIYPLVSHFIGQMIQQNRQHKPLGLEDVKSVLETGSLAIFASAKGYDTNEMLVALVDSMTDRILKPKGCLVHLMVHNDCPVDIIERILGDLENKLFSNERESLDSDTSRQYLFISGKGLSDALKKDEIFIRILLSV